MITPRKVTLGICWGGLPAPTGRGRDMRSQSIARPCRGGAGGGLAGTGAPRATE